MQAFRRSGRVSDGSENDGRPTVVHIITNLGLGGAETALLRLATNAVRYRHSVISLIDKAAIGPSLEAGGVPVRALHVNRVTSFLAAPARLRSLVRSLRPTLVQGWMTHGNLAASLAIWPARVPLIWSVRQSVIDFTYEKPATAAALLLSARLAGTADSIVYNSLGGARDHERLGYPPTLGRHIPNGFDTERFAPSAEARFRLREALGVGADTVLVGLFGRLHPQKNQEGFLQAAAKILDQRPHRVQFVLAGEGTEPTNPSLQAILPPGDVASKTLVLGARTDMPDLMAALDILVNCSFGEGFPNVVGEAMACGVPCIVTDVGDSALIVGEAGVVVPPGDQQALERALQATIDLDSDARASLGWAGRQRVLDNFSLSSIVRQYEDLYDDLVKRRSQRRVVHG